jgi:hypothetical protein
MGWLCRCFNAEGGLLMRKYPNTIQDGPNDKPADKVSRQTQV